jgi:hypothetical protein
MTYQPPIIGTKQILNFTASAWPASGGIAILVAFALAAGAVWLSVRDARGWAAGGLERRTYSLRPTADSRENPGRAA